MLWYFLRSNLFSSILIYKYDWFLDWILWNDNTYQIWPIIPMNEITLFGPLTKENSNMKSIFYRNHATTPVCIGMCSYVICFEIHLALYHHPLVQFLLVLHWLMFVLPDFTYVSLKHNALWKCIMLQPFQMSVSIKYIC